MVDGIVVAAWLFFGGGARGRCVRAHWSLGADRIGLARRLVGLDRMFDAVGLFFHWAFWIRFGCGPNIAYTVATDRRPSLVEAMRALGI